MRLGSHPLDPDQGVWVSELLAPHIFQTLRRGKTTESRSTHVSVAIHAVEALDPIGVIRLLGQSVRLQEIAKLPMGEGFSYRVTSTALPAEAFAGRDAHPLERAAMSRRSP